MSESNAMPIPTKPELERFVRLMLADYPDDDDSDAQMMEWLARKLMQAEQRVQELEADLITKRKQVLEEAAQAASRMTYNGDYYSSKTDQYDAGVNAAVKAIRALLKPKVKT